MSTGLEAADRMVYADSPWHRRGPVLGRAFTAEEGLRITGLDFDPLKVPLYGTVGGEVIESGSYMIVRSTDRLVVGSGVGRLYTPHAPREVLDFLDNLVEAGGEYVSFGTLHGGSWLYATMKIPAGILVGGVEPVDLYVVVLDSYDGSKPLTVLATPVVAVCGNTVALALAQALATWRLKHTQNLAGKVQDARESLALTFAYGEAWQAEMDALVQREVVLAEAERIIRNALPGTPDEGEAFTAPQREVLDLYTGGMRIADSLRGANAYSLLMAASEAGSWTLPTQRASKRDPQERRMEAVLFGKSRTLAQSVYDALKV